MERGWERSNSTSFKVFEAPLVLFPELSLVFEEKQTLLLSVLVLRVSSQAI